jgi:hypothetical protein
MKSKKKKAVVACGGVVRVNVADLVERAVEEGVDGGCGCCRAMLASKCLDVKCFDGMVESIKCEVLVALTEVLEFE